MTYDQNGAGPHTLTSAAGVTYAYDRAGNLTSRGAATYVWDYRGRLTTANDGAVAASYTYNAEGQRVLKSVSQYGSTSTTLYLGDYAELRGSQWIFYIMADSGQRRPGCQSLRLIPADPRLRWFRKPPFHHSHDHLVPVRSSP